MSSALAGDADQEAGNEDCNSEDQRCAQRKPDIGLHRRPGDQ